MIVSLFLITFLFLRASLSFPGVIKESGAIRTSSIFYLFFYLVNICSGYFRCYFYYQGCLTITRLLNWVSISLIIISLVQILFTQGRVLIANEKVKRASINPTVLHPPQGKPLPDIYYIVLDMHTRSDVLNQDYGYDETVFIKEMKNMGFFIAECSRSNYGETSESITSTLNLDYLDKIATDFKLTSNDARYSLLKQSFVRTESSKTWL